MELWLIGDWFLSNRKYFWILHYVIRNSSPYYKVIVSALQQLWVSLKVPHFCDGKLWKCPSISGDRNSEMISEVQNWQGTVRHFHIFQLVRRLFDNQIIKFAACNAIVTDRRNPPCQFVLTFTDLQNQVLSKLQAYFVRIEAAINNFLFNEI